MPNRSVLAVISHLESTYIKLAQGKMWNSDTRIRRVAACSYCAAKRATAQRPAVEAKGENCLASAQAIVAEILLAR
jgi:hypothetical protein